MSLGKLQQQGFPKVKGLLRDWRCDLSYRNLSQKLLRLEIWGYQRCNGGLQFLVSSLFTTLQFFYSDEDKQEDLPSPTLYFQFPQDSMPLDVNISYTFSLKPDGSIDLGPFSSLSTVQIKKALQSVLSWSVVYHFKQILPKYTVIEQICYNWVI